MSERQRQRFLRIEIIYFCAPIESGDGAGGLVCDDVCAQAVGHRFGASLDKPV